MVFIVGAVGVVPMAVVVVIIAEVVVTVEVVGAVVEDVVNSGWILAMREALLPVVARPRREQ